jgi:hypothetical protein
MLRDILTIPFKLAKMQSDGYGKNFVTMQFFPETVYTPEQMKSYKRGIKGESIEWVLDTNRCIGFYDLMWSDVLSLLQLTYFGKYSDIQEGVERYSSPISFDDCEFTVELNGRDRIDWVEIRDISFGEYNLDDDEKDEEFGLIETMIANLNKHITYEPFKMVFDRATKTIKFSITGVAISLMYDAAHSGEVIDPKKLRIY